MSRNPSKKRITVVTVYPPIFLIWNLVVFSVDVHMVTS